VFPRPPRASLASTGAPLNSLFTITYVDRASLSSRGARAVTLVRDLVITATRTRKSKKGCVFERNPLIFWLPDLGSNRDLRLTVRQIAFSARFSATIDHRRSSLYIHIHQ